MCGPVLLKFCGYVVYILRHTWLKYFFLKKCVQAGILCSILIMNLSETLHVTVSPANVKICCCCLCCFVTFWKNKENVFIKPFCVVKLSN